MRARGGGSIVHIGSALGEAAAPFFAPYVASKGGLNALARAAAVELVRDGIRVNVVAPGTIDTVISQGVSDFRRGMLERRIPIGRAGHVDDIAAACLYLFWQSFKANWHWMTGWIAIGLLIYFGYSRRHSKLNKQAS